MCRREHGVQHECFVITDGWTNTQERNRFSALSGIQITCSVCLLDMEDTRAKVGEKYLGPDTGLPRKGNHV